MPLRTITEPRPHVLVVDDEEDLCELLSLRLEHEGFRCTTCTGSASATSVLRQDTVDAMVLDLRLEGESGLDLLDAALHLSPDLPIVMLTAHGTMESAVDSMKRGAYGFVTKPFDDRELIQELRQAVEHGRLKQELAGLRRIVSGESKGHKLIGTSQKIVFARELISRAAPSDATILILGESGTGKEVAARSVHEQSPRSQNPFVAINCGALPGDLLESELFGYVRGAFTGANKSKEGLFAAAHGGTIFLDEVGDAPASVQVKLLRVLQERVYYPVGSTTPQEMDVRVIAATNRDLAEEVKRGRFREDLFYRLHVVPLQMPPLRERTEDIPILTDVFLARTCAQYRLPRPILSEGALQNLLAHDFPGNVRELANIVEGAVILSRGNRIDPEHLASVMIPSERLAARSSVPPPKAAWQSADGSFLALKEARLAFEKAYLQDVLRSCGGNVSAAARVAGRHRTDLHELLRRHGISASDFRGSGEEESN